KPIHFPTPLNDGARGDRPAIDSSSAFPSLLVRAREITNEIFCLFLKENLCLMTTPIFLNALRAFEASARHQGFSAAAVELNVTPAAVGQMVRSLEEWLGVSLFHRGGGRARLTPTD